MKLSIVIVNYNVKHFLEQCLYSVFEALNNLETEVFVVDNNSHDGSCEMVREKFPNVKLIANKDNHGFSYANNQAMRIATGKYFLLLNPDTVVEEDTFDKVVSFMDAHPDAGGLGVRMIDGKGNFLPESKRGLPTPMVSFYKIFGLSQFFPKSKRFGRYHLGFLDEHRIHQVDVLAGAFMLMRKETLDEVGLLDEAYFMYGEDIDLSYRIILGGYKNYYFPETTIIHYKGESTKKGSVNYVKIFYKAMIIFAQNHFSKRYSVLFSLVINTAVYFRAFLAILYRLLSKLLLPFKEKPSEAPKRFIIVGEDREIDRIRNILSEIKMKTQLVGKVWTGKDEPPKGYLGSTDQLPDLLSSYMVDELIFCLKDISSKEIIKQIQKFKDLDLYFKIAPPSSNSIIGSNNMNTAGDLYSIEN